MTAWTGFAEVDCSVSPPRVSVPRQYNAAIDLIDRHVRCGRGHRIAIRDDGGAYSYGELAERTDRAAAVLRSLSVEPEQRVLLCLTDNIDFPTVFFGAMKAGAVPVPANTLLTTADYRFLLADSRARVLILSDSVYAKFAPLLDTARTALPFLKHVVVASAQTAPHTPVPGRPPEHHLHALLAAAHPDAAAVAPTTCDDAAFWLYTSGSTGTPKGAIHLHASLVQTAALYGCGILQMNADDVVFSAAKLPFAYGLGNSLTLPLYIGASTVLLAGRPTPAEVMRVLAAHQPTIFCGVPTLFAAILADPALAEKPGSSALRYSISAGEALPRHLGERWRARFGSDILDGIGSTELLHIFLTNRPGDVVYGTTGKPVPGYALQLVADGDYPNDAATDDGGADEGALWVRGPSTCSGYFCQRERSLTTFHGPWTRTGDRYTRDRDGYFTYCGRTDDMLKVGGHWVAPFEVESALAAHDAVLEAAVVAQVDDDQLVKPKAFVVLKQPGDADAELVLILQAFIKGRLAPYKYPRWIEFVAELPKTATGKTQRFKLRG